MFLLLKIECFRGSKGGVQTRRCRLLSDLLPTKEKHESGECISDSNCERNSYRIRSSTLNCFLHGLVSPFQVFLFFEHIPYKKD